MYNLMSCSFRGASTLDVACRGVAQPGRAPGSGPGGRRFKSSLPDQYFSTTYNFTMARNRAQTEPLVRADWVPQTKFLTSKDLLAAGDESRGTHNNKGGGESRETSPKLRLLNECGAD